MRVAQSVRGLPARSETGRLVPHARDAQRAQSRQPHRCAKIIVSSPVASALVNQPPRHRLDSLMRQARPSQARPGSVNARRCGRGRVGVPPRKKQRAERQHGAKQTAHQPALAQRTDGGSRARHGRRVQHLRWRSSTWTCPVASRLGGRGAAFASHHGASSLSFGGWALPS